MLKRILYLSRTKFYKEIDKIAFNKKFDLSKAITIHGAPRSGTTWLVDILNTIPKYLVLFEPFFAELFPEINNYNIGPRPYRNPAEEDTELRQLLCEIFTGKIPSKDPNIPMKLYDIFKRINASKLLIKFTRGTRLLPWIENNFEFKKTFLLLRHPAATISSQIQSGLTGYGRGVFPTKKDLIIEVSGLDLLPDSIIDRIDKLNKKEEFLALTYALDYSIPYMLAENKFTPLVYERILTESENEIPRIFKMLDEETYIQKALKRIEDPSHTTMSSEKDYLNETKKQLSKWEKRLSKEETENIRKVLDWFDIDFSSDSYSIMKNEIQY